jgi:hypothetical protein
LVRFRAERFRAVVFAALADFFLLDDEPLAREPFLVLGRFADFLGAAMRVSLGVD